MRVAQRMAEPMKAETSLARMRPRRPTRVRKMRTQIRTRNRGMRRHCRNRFALLRGRRRWRKHLQDMFRLGGRQTSAGADSARKWEKLRWLALQRMPLPHLRQMPPCRYEYGRASGRR